MRAILKKVLLVGGMMGLASLSYAQFTTVKIGNDAVGSITPNGGGSFSVIGGGDDIWGDSGDDFTYHYVNVSGDFDVRMRVESLEMAATWTKAGIMARENDDRFSRMAFSRATPAGGANDVHFGYRTDQSSGGPGNHEDGGDSPQFPNCWLRLQRVGNHMKSFSSHDGSTWNPLGDQDTATWTRGGVATPFDNPTRVGIAVSRHSGGLATVHCEIRDYGSTSDDPVISRQPANNAANTGQTATFSVDVAGGYDFVSFQWKRGGTDIPGATGRTYTTSPVSSADNGAHFSVLVHNDLNNSSTLSADGVLGVDVPGIVAVGNLGRNDQICIRFNKAIAPADAANSSLYSVNNGVTVNSAAASASDPAVVVLSVSTLTAGTTYIVTAHDVHDPSGSVQSPNPASSSFQNSGYVPVQLTYRRYENLGAGTVALSSLTNSPNFPNNPNLARYNMALAEIPDQGIDGFGGQLKGYYRAPSSGNYQFAIASDDNGALFVATDANPAHKVQIASMPDWTGVREYVQRTDPNNLKSFTETVSAPITLTAGQLVYLEGIYKEGGGGDHIEIAVRRPGDVAIVDGLAGIALDQFAPDPSGLSLFGGQAYTPGDITLTAQPASASVVEGQTVVFRTDFTGTPPYTISWYENGVAVPNSNTKTLSVFASVANDGHVFHAVVQNLCSVATTGDASLAVAVDNTQPTVADAGCDPVDKKVRVVFSEPVTAGTATDLGNYAFIDGSGLTIDSAQLLSDNRSVLLTASDVLVPNQLYSLHIQNILDRSLAGNTMDPIDVPITGCICSNGVIMREIYDNIGGGTTVPDLTNNVKFVQNRPDSIDFLTVFNSPTRADNYGVRMVAYLIPPVTGNYNFQLLSDDSSVIYLSPDTDPNHKKVLIRDDSCCNIRSTTTPTPLVGGQAYYIEGLMKEGIGGDYLTLSWTYPGQATSVLIPGSAMRFCYDPQKVVLQVSGLENKEVEACRSVTFAPTYTISGGQGAVTYQWLREGSEILGETNATYTIPHADATYNDALIQVRVSALLRNVTSEPVFLTVENDTDVPTIVGAVGDISRHHAIVTFSEAMDPSTATDRSLYSITGPGGPLTITSAAIANGSNVVLTTFEQLAEGDTYTVTISDGIMDLCVANAAVGGDSATFKGWVFLPCTVLMQAYDLAPFGSAQAVSILTSSPLYPNHPRDTFYIHSVDSRQGYPDDTHEFYGGRMTGFIVPSATANYVFQFWNDDDFSFRLNNGSAGSSEDPAGAVQVALGPCCNSAFANPSAAITLNAGQRYYFEGLWKEGGGGDYLRVGMAPSGSAPTSFIGPEFIGTYVDPALVSTIAPTLPIGGKLANGSLTKRGFDVHTVQVGTNIDNLLSIAELLLAGNGGPNLSTLPFSFEGDAINYSVENATSYGSIPNDRPFPGIPGTTASTDNIAMEATAYVELHTGFHCMIVNSDDGFKVTPALCAADADNALVLGSFDGGRGATDSPFVFYVPEDGLYPMRLVWQQGGGGGNVEWVDIQPSGSPTRVSVNGNNNIKAFSASQFVAVVSGNNLNITWNSTASCPFRLQQTTELMNPSSATVWTDVAGAGSASVPISATGNAFFRLIRP